MKYALTADATYHHRALTPAEYKRHLDLLRDVAWDESHPGQNSRTYDRWQRKERDDTDHVAWIAAHRHGLVRENTQGIPKLTSLGRVYLEQREASQDRSVRRDPGLNKKALHKTIDADLKAKAKRNLNRLRAELALAVRHDRKRCGMARYSARVRIAKLREREKKLHALVQKLVARERARKNTLCERTGSRAARASWQKERAYQESLRRSTSAALKKNLRPGLATRRSESDETVRSNIPADLRPLFERVKRGIRGNGRKSRTEEFLEYVDAHPREAYADADDATDRLVADLERQNRAGRRRDVSRANHRRRYRRSFR